MGEGAKGPTFNGAYYGAAPVNPPMRPPRRHRSCVGRVLKCLVQLILAVVIVLGVAALVVWLVLRPSEPKFYVDTVALNNAANTTSATLLLGMSVRNANKKIGFYYDAIHVSARYGGQTIGIAGLPEFYQGHKNTTTFRPALSFESVAVLNNSGEAAPVEVRLRSQVRFKVGKVKTRRLTLKVKCPLSVPLSLNASTFSRKRCDVDFDR